LDAPVTCTATINVTAVAAKTIGLFATTFIDTSNIYLQPTDVYTDA